MSNREQKLVDLCFEIGLSLSTLGKMSISEKADWIELWYCGFKTKPVGSSWGVLIKGDENDNR